MDLTRRLPTINVYRYPFAGYLDPKHRTWAQMPAVWQKRLRSGMYSPVDVHRYMKQARYDREDIRRALAAERPQDAHLFEPCPVIDNYDIEAGQRSVDEYRAKLQAEPAAETFTLPWRCNPRPGVIVKAIRDLQVGQAVVFRYDANLTPPGLLLPSITTGIHKETSRAKRAEHLGKRDGRKYTATRIENIGVSVTRVR
jgi:hypothetical protein